MKYRFAMAVLCLFMTDCQTKKGTPDPDIERIKISLEGFKHTLDISEMFEARFIPLETVKESLVGDIDKVLVHDSLIYVLDRFKAKKLFVFNMAGKFIRTIGKPGKGEGEYVKLCDFDVAGNRVYISSLRDNRMLIFGTDGRRIRDIKFSGYIGMDFKVLKENRGFVVNGPGGSNKSATIYDMNGKKGAVITNPGIDYMYYSNSFCFFDSNNGLYMYFAMNDTIYQVGDEELLPKYIIDMGSKSFPYAKMKNKDMIKEYKEKKEFMEFHNFSTFSTYHLIGGSDKGLSWNVLINKNDGSLLSANVLMYRGIPLAGPLGYTENGPIYCWNPSTVPLQKDTSIFVPPGYWEASPNDNPGIIILTEK